MNRKILILGATSAIAEAYARLRAAENASLVLVARDSKRLQAIAQDLRVRGAQAVHALTEDLSDTSNVTSRFQAMVSPVGGIDEILVAYGILGDQIKGEIDPKLAEETMR